MRWCADRFWTLSIAPLRARASIWRPTEPARSAKQLGRHSTKFGGAYQKFIWPMWGFFQNRDY